MIARLESLVEAMQSPSSPNLNGMPSGGRDGISKTDRQIQKKCEIEAKLDELIKRERILKQEIEKMAELLNDHPDEQAIIEMRYIDMLRWTDVCAALFSEMNDYDDQTERYMKRTFRLHGTALQRLARRIDDRPA